ncbi:MAG TPA: hypothetical protein VHL60_05160 [Oxalicibacterium sp.]|jgi:hypothetical protein|nr:hypothetical protein [Oxalicibacterium sp.]
MKSRLPRVLLAAAALAIVLLAVFIVLRKPIYRFAGWSGPQEASAVLSPVATTPSLYGQGGENALAIYLTDWRTG